MAYSYDYPHPAVTTDIVVFTERDAELHVLLIERADPPYRGNWALPGGFVDIGESLDACARRELREETGIDNVELEQLHCFGEPGRDPRERVITIAYVGLLDSGQVVPTAGSDAADVAWFSPRELPELAFDHREIIAMACEKLEAASGAAPRARPRRR